MMILGVMRLPCSSEKASEAVKDKAEASEAKKDEEQEEEEGDDAVDWWGGATSWMSSTVSSVSQVRLLLSFQYMYMRWPCNNRHV